MDKNKPNPKPSTTTQIKQLPNITTTQIETKEEESQATIPETTIKLGFFERRKLSQMIKQCRQNQKEFLQSIISLNEKKQVAIQAIQRLEQIINITNEQTNKPYTTQQYQEMNLQELETILNQALDLCETLV